MDFKDYYSTLGVAKTATQKEIKQAFRKLARTHHPDVNPGDKSAETKFKEINEAYDVLGDADKRKKYDELGANWRMYEQAGAGGPGASEGWNVNYGGGRPGGGFRTMTEDEMRDMFEGDASPFSDFFQTFFGGARPGGAAGEARGGRRRVARKGRDVEHELTLGLEDAYRGTTQRLTVQMNGQSRTVDVRIPPGVGDGARVRVTGEGEMGSEGASSGDLYLRIRLAPHATFERKGRDLYTKVPVPVTTAVLGGEAEVQTLAGKPLRLKIPATTQNAQTFRLRGHGMPAVGKPQETGDLYATVDVELPRTLDDEQRRHYEELRKLDKGST
jgi:curved DNA-binding protein